YFPRIYWLSNSQDLIVLKMNRLQNKVEFFRCNMQTKAKDVVLTDENACWIDITDNYYFLNDNKTVIFLSERDGYRHIYKAEFGKTPVQLTSGKYEVAEISAIDFQKKMIYYLSNETAVPNQDLFSINFDGKKKKMLTDGTGWNDPTFNSNAHFYCNTYSDANTPPVYTLHSANGKLLYTIQDNAAFKNKMQDYGFTTKDLFTFTTSEGVELEGWMMKPKDFDPNKKYPVLMYVYGGPETPQVLNNFSSPFDFAWYQMLCQKGYIVACVDGRGTGRKGDAFTKVIYKQMGKYEAIDQIEAAKYFKSLPYVDDNRVGIWGWSFGGYLSALSMFKGEGTFKMAISVAPVTNWRYYDNIYTERYLQKPQDNPSGYDDNSPCFFADQLEGNYLLIHGTADDNVHFQNAIDLVTQLNKANKQYEMFFYPNKNHSIYGGNTRLHLYNKLTNFILENL
ncbi:MAG: prolyl oligopeptidase family serine peptidase, partial [Bacteroidales bacterium]|nr:prolyl oligopeptidase family serine peptidase [Bacteroidales bacterium]